VAFLNNTQNHPLLLIIVKVKDTTKLMGRLEMDQQPKIHSTK